ncbi:putative transcription factor GRF family [Helianthus annuus]|uniref:Transcription factor GRF family n=1 Tax=Helianthus annuus TaxID=4232 RepID=A0A9K3N137_HELAN|nr:putative transcription factor GRF family [Helianthus annuus]KAJ0502133.1 putative transcription factor GRF family [Helianthus annuus]KAJ0510104.1 putative transcription factor GRF family [Helianthus annuus]KAJ0518052.1 putative transcription factor GRF family [Helianthus annuus]KAJ0686079.1 putative transcription factor GRF family [Helianthus annuus]
MSSSSTSASTLFRNPKMFKVDLQGNVYCHHDIIAVIRVVGRKSVRQGQEFYGCSQRPRFDCKFFLWKEDVDNMFKQHASDCRFSYEDLKYQNMDLQNKLLVEENKLLKTKISGVESKGNKPYVLNLFIAFTIVLYMFR